MSTVLLRLSLHGERHLSTTLLSETVIGISSGLETRTISNEIFVVKVEFPAHGAPGSIPGDQTHMPFLCNAAFYAF